MLAIAFAAVEGVATVDVLVEVVSSLSLMSVVIKIALPPCFNKLYTVLDGPKYSEQDAMLTTSVKLGVI